MDPMEMDSIPKVEIDGENYDVGGAKAILSMVIGHLSTAFFILLFLQDTFFQPFGGIQAMPQAVKDFNNACKESPW